MDKDAKHLAFDVMDELSKQIARLVIARYTKDQIVYAQGDSADSVLYVHRGTVKISVISERGREAIIALRGPDEFSGVGVLTGKLQRLATMTAVSPCEIVRLETGVMTRLLHDSGGFSNCFITHLLTRTARVEADLVDRMFNPSEMRLARALLILANYGDDKSLVPLPITINQDTLAKMIGTTRGRVNFFMNKFRDLGLINYNGKIEVKIGLLHFVLNERHGDRKMDVQRAFEFRSEGTANYGP